MTARRTTATTAAVPAMPTATYPDAVPRVSPSFARGRVMMPSLGNYPNGTCAAVLGHVVTRTGHPYAS